MVESSIIGKVFPLNQAVFTQTMAKLTCTSTTDVIWKKGKLLINSSTHVNIQKSQNYEHTLLLKNINVTDSGLYKCLGTNYNGKSFVATSYLFVGGNLVYFVYI